MHAARWLAQVGEDAARIAEHFDLGGLSADAAAFWEKAARRALATNALQEAVRMADMALPHADDRPCAFARALLLDEAWSRLDPRAGRRLRQVRQRRGGAREGEGHEVRERHPRHPMKLCW